MCSTERRPCVETRNLKLWSRFSDQRHVLQVGKTRLVLLLAGNILWPTWWPLPASSQTLIIGYILI